MAFYGTGSLLGVDAVFTTIQNLLTSSAGGTGSNGWTGLMLNTSTMGSPTPGLGGAVGTRETIFRANGSGSDATRWYLSMCRATDSSNGDNLVFTAFTTVKNFDNPVSVSNMVRFPNNVVQVTCSSPHNLTVGDRFLFNGSSNPALNDIWGPLGSAQVSANPSVSCIVQSTSSATEFRFVSTSTSGSTGSGGFVLPVYNLCSSRGTRVGSTNAGSNIFLTDSQLALYMYYDAYRFCGVVIQGGTYQAFYFGESARDHIGSDFRDRAFITASISSGTVTASLDRSCPNLNIGQRIMIINASGSNGTSSFENSIVLNKLSNTQFVCSITGSYSSGSLIGADALPIGIISTFGGGLGISSALSAKTTQFMFNPDGTRTAANGQIYAAFTDTGGTESVMDPDDSGMYIGREIWVGKTTTPSGMKGRLIGLVAFPLGAQNDLDLIRVGKTPTVDDYKQTITSTVDGTWAIGIGPGAS